MMLLSTAASFAYNSTYIDPSVAEMAPMRITCPHCQNEIELDEKAVPEEIQCPSCGSSFHLEPKETKEWQSGDAQRTLGRFVLLETVGSGGFGTVYRARDPKLDRIVAVKVPRRAAGFNPAESEDRDRFLREARSVAQLRHPSIVPVYEVGEVDGQPFLVSEFVAGATLADRLTARRPTFRQAAELIAAVADALQFAHERGVVHRDIKPSNIMIGNDGTPHLMDFGLAKRDAGEITMTMDGQVLGTPAYMSPEQARGEAHNVDGRSDLYSLGVILYELLTGELPFRGNTRMLLHQVLHDDPRPPRRLNDRIPRDLETICLKALAKEPGRRYQSAGAMGEDLRRWLRGEAITARRVGQIEKFTRWCRRNPALTTVSGLAIVLLVGVAIVSVLFAVSESRYSQGLAEINQNLVLEKQETKRAYDKAATSRNQAEEQQRRAESTLASTLALEKGLQLCEQSRSGHGLLWLVRSLELTPLDASDLRQRILQNIEGWQQSIHPLRQVLEHGDSVNAVAFSPDGKMLATVSSDQTAQVWDVITGQRILPPLRHQGAVRTVAFSPDGKLVLTGSDDHTAGLWDLTTGMQVFSLSHQDAVTVLAFSPNGNFVLTASKDQRARLWDARSGVPIGDPLQHKGPILAVAFSRDSSLAATGSADYTARVWESATAKPISPMLQHPNVVHVVAFRPDGKAVLVAGGGGLGEGEAQFRDVATGKQLGDVIKENEFLRWLAFAASDRLILTGGGQTVRLRNALTGEVLSPPFVHYGDLIDAALNQDATVLITAGGANARVWDVASGKPLGPDLWHENGCNCIALSPDGRFLVTGGRDRCAKIWELISPPKILKHPGWVTGAVFHPDGRTVLTASKEGTVRLWDCKTARLISHMPLAKVDYHHANMWHITMSPGGEKFATDSDRLQVWETSTGKPVGRPHDVFPIHGTLNLDGSLRAVVTSEGHPSARSAVARDFDSDRLLGPSLPHWPGLCIGAISRHYRYVLIGYQRDGARLWEVATGKMLAQFPHPSRVLIVAFSPDERAVLTGGRDGTARIWETTTGKMIGEPLAHNYPVRSAAFSPDGRTFLLGTEEGTVRLWDFASRRPIGLPSQHGARVQTICFASDGQSFVTGSYDETARIWKTPVPIEGSLERITLWAQTLTGMELDDKDSPSFLNGSTWRKRRELLEKFGGPPFPSWARK